MDYREYKELKHHGVLGMHWGIRKKEELSPRKPGMQTNEEWLSARRKKQIKMGLMIAGAGLAVYGAYRLGVLNPKILKTSEEAFKAVSTDVKSTIGNVNPHYTTNQLDPNFLGSNMNCGNSTIAAELNWRGEKTFATLNKTGMLPEHFGTYFNLQPKSISTLRIGNMGGVGTLEHGIKVRKMVEDHIFKTYPEGARGSMYVPFTQGAHFMSFTRLKNGVRIDNPQNLGLDINDIFSDVITKGTPGADRYGIKLMRLDNAPINRKYLDEVVTKDISQTTSTFQTMTVRGGKAVAKMFGEGKNFDPRWGLTLVN